jgi:hypothetical protein
MSRETSWKLCLLPERHPGLTEAKAVTLCECAGVCLQRHHRSPTELDLRIHEDVSKRAVTWVPPTARERNANRNAVDATCEGAYAIALLCLEHELTLVAVGRAEQGSGADWYVAPPGRGLDDAGEPNPDDPAILRLEVGGHDDRPSLPHELKLKVQQLRAGKSAVPGIAAVIGFKKARVLIHTGVTSGTPEGAG